MTLVVTDYTSILHMKNKTNELNYMEQIYS